MSKPLKSVLFLSAAFLVVFSANASYAQDVCSAEDIQDAIDAAGCSGSEGVYLNSDSILAHVNDKCGAAKSKAACARCLEKVAPTILGLAKIGLLDKSELPSRAELKSVCSGVGGDNGSGSDNPGDNENNAPGDGDKGPGDHPTPVPPGSATPPPTITANQLANILLETCPCPENLDQKQNFSACIGSKLHLLQTGKAFPTDVVTGALSSIRVTCNLPSGDK